MHPRIITIDGPASSGKGTLARLIAARLGFHYLESGAIYRCLGLFVSQNYPTASVSPAQVSALIAALHLEFSGEKILLNSQDVTLAIRAESIGMLASKYSAIPEVRARLLQFQRDFARVPGLVTDGRDMGSIVFPEATLKVFLTATSEIRAQRRYKQLQQLDKSVTITAILQDIIARDQQDCERSTAPLSYDTSFKVLDNSQLSLEESIELILSWYSAVAR